MNEFWAGLAGVVVGGALSLYGVFRTLKKQDERDRLADERHLRDRKYDRLREAYRKVVATAYHYSHHASVLAIAEHQARTEGKPDFLTQAINQPAPDPGDAHATLLLESEADRAILDKVGDLATAHYLFAFALISDEAMDPDEELRQLSSMQDTVDELAALARAQLAAMDQPLG